MKFVKSHILNVWEYSNDVCNWSNIRDIQYEKTVNNNEWCQVATNKLERSRIDFKIKFREMNEKM